MPCIHHGAIIPRELHLPLQQAIALVLFRIYSDLKREVSRSMIGLAWWFFEPALYLGTFYLVFGWGMDQRGTGFASFLMCGLVSWKWFGASVQSSASSISAHHGLISQIYAPKWIFPTVVIGANAIKFLILLALLMLILPLMGYSPSWQWLWLGPIVCGQFLLICGCALTLSALVPLFPDLKVLVGHGLIAMMFASGLTFHLDTLSSPVREWMEYNPMAQNLAYFRTVLLQCQAPDLFGLWLNLSCGLLLLVSGLILLKRLDGTFAKISP